MRKSLLSLILFYFPVTILSLPFFPSCRLTISSVPKSCCNWEGARSETAKPSPPHNAGSTEGGSLPNAQNCSDENKLTSQSWTQIPSSSTWGCEADRRISGGWFGAPNIFSLSGLIKKKSLQSSMSINAVIFCSGDSIGCFFPPNILVRLRYLCHLNLLSSYHFNLSLSLCSLWTYCTLNHTVCA